MKPVYIIGMGMSPADLSREALDRIHGADILAGGRRHLDFFPDISAEKMEIVGNLSDVIQCISEKRTSKDIAVLASGDPMYYGIGPLIVNRLGPDAVRIIPNITSVAAAFARIRESWHDAHVVSLHGRTAAPDLWRIFEEKDKIAVFTDPERHPGWLARALLERGLDDLAMCVCARMGAADESVQWHSLAQTAGMRFPEPNMAVLRRRSPRKPGPATLGLGMPDAAYHRDRGLITKPEVRAVTLSKLRLTSSGLVMWDLGAGSGSVSVEASLFLKTGAIYAVEKKPERIAMIRANKEKYGVRNLHAVEADLPEGVANLPAPDRVFIGGGGKDLPDIMRSALGALKPGGVMVVNTVLIPNIQRAFSVLEDHGMEADLTQVQVSNIRKMPWAGRLEAQNPVWIISGAKKGDA